MKVMKGILVNHTTKTPDCAEQRFYTTTVEDVAKDDVFAVWAHGRLSFFKVKSVMETYEYLPAENGGVKLEDVSNALNRIDFKAYNVAKKVLEKTKRIRACIAERLAEAKESQQIADLIKTASTTERKAEIKALQDQLKALAENPESVLDD